MMPWAVQIKMQETGWAFCWRGSDRHVAAWDHRETAEGQAKALINTLPEGGDEFVRVVEVELKIK